jgi:ribonuclease T1
VPPPRRTRRPLLALIALVVLLIVGYTARAVSEHSSQRAPARPSTSASITPRLTAAGRPSTTTSTTTSGATGAIALVRLPVRSGPVPSVPSVPSRPVPSRQTIALIRRGGSYPYSRDGSIFGNLEHRPPAPPRGYRHEYTVTTPGSSDRGIRRIIIGADGQFCLTSDRYDSFTAVDTGS